LKNTIFVTSFRQNFGEPVYTYSLKEGINDGFLKIQSLIKSSNDILFYLQKHDKNMIIALLDDR